MLQQKARMVSIEKWEKHQFHIENKTTTELICVPKENVLNVAARIANVEDWKNVRYISHI